MNKKSKEIKSKIYLATQLDRNLIIYKRHKNGESAMKLAIEYGISCRTIQRIFPRVARWIAEGLVKLPIDT